MVASNNPTRRSSWGLKPLDSPSAVEDFGAGWTVLKRDTPDHSRTELIPPEKDHLEKTTLMMS
jgi:hypothetical protein